ncbi:MAG: hypothetical protein ACLFVZ_08410 [Actinomycetota bacterium]
MTSPETFAARLLSSHEVEEEWQDEWKRRVANEWRDSVPVLTGEYRASIHETEDGAAASADHAPYVEYGTSDTAAQPALVPAINRHGEPSARDAGRRVIDRLT